MYLIKNVQIMEIDFCCEAWKHEKEKIFLSEKLGNPSILTLLAPWFCLKHGITTLNPQLYNLRLLEVLDAMVFWVTFYSNQLLYGSLMSV
jgi:hypothetical protein